MKVAMLPASPVPNPQATSSVAASLIIASRPIRSAIRPPIIAPGAAPSSAAAAAKPSSALPRRKSAASPLIAPLVTEMS